MRIAHDAVLLLLTCFVALSMPGGIRKRLAQTIAETEEPSTSQASGSRASGIRQRLSRQDVDAVAAKTSTGIVTKGWACLGLACGGARGHEGRQGEPECLDGL